MRVPITQSFRVGQRNACIERDVQTVSLLYAAVDGPVLLVSCFLVFLFSCFLVFLSCFLVFPQAVDEHDDAKEGFIEALVEKLKPQAYPPGTIVMRQGDVAGAMYFVSGGCAEVWNSEHTVMYGVKNEVRHTNKIYPNETKQKKQLLKNAIF